MTGTGLCDQCATSMEVKDLKQCAKCRYVPFSLTGDRSVSHLAVSGSPSTASVSPNLQYLRTLILNLPCHTHPNLQSKECQKTHWKWLHKTACPLYATARQNYKESHKQRVTSREAARWIDAWSPAIAFCSPVALDLVNHERGRHETHRYGSYVV